MIKMPKSSPDLCFIVNLWRKASISFTVQKSFEISGNACLKCKFFFCMGMYYRNRHRVKREPLNTLTLIPILFISDYRMPFLRKMNPDLVFPAGKQIYFKQTVFVGFFQDFISPSVGRVSQLVESKKHPFLQIVS